MERHLLSTWGRSSLIRRNRYRLASPSLPPPSLSPLSLTHTSSIFPQTKRVKEILDEDLAGIANPLIVQPYNIASKTFDGENIILNPNEYEWTRFMIDRKEKIEEYFRIWSLIVAAIGQRLPIEWCVNTADNADNVLKKLATTLPNIKNQHVPKRKEQPLTTERLIFVKVKTIVNGKEVDRVQLHVGFDGADDKKEKKYRPNNPKDAIASYIEQNLTADLLRREVKIIPDLTVSCL